MKSKSYDFGGAMLHAGDCVAILPTLGPVDAIVTDPPYHLVMAHERASAALRPDQPISRMLKGFMGKAWDGGDIAFRPETWAAIGAPLKPGGYLLAFGGSRTHHRIWCAIEDAGFVIQDTIMWLYGQGFPKGRTQLKPAFEPICVAYKPGGKRTLNIDECRIPGATPSIHRRETARQTGNAPGRPGEYGHTITNRITPEAYMADRPGELLGRWPANVCHSGDDEVMEAFAAFGEKDARPVRPENIGKSGCGERRALFGNVSIVQSGFYDRGTAARFFKACPADDNELLIWRAGAIMAQCNPELANTADGHSSLSKKAAVSALSDAVIWASRGALSLTGSNCRGLSTSATPSELRTLSESAITAILKSENGSLPGSRQEKHTLNGSRANVAVTTALTGITTITISHWRSDGSAAPVTFRCTPRSVEVGVPVLAGTDRFHYCAKASKADRAGSKHPTVKPIALMRWLVRLVTPPGGTVLDPFAGSGTTGAAAIAEGRNAILIEREPEYIGDIRRRLKPRPIKEAA